MMLQRTFVEETETFSLKERQILLMFVKNYFKKFCPKKG